MDEGRNDHQTRGAAEGINAGLAMVEDENLLPGAEEDLAIIREVALRIGSRRGRFVLGLGGNGRILMDSMTYRTTTAITRKSLRLFGDLEVACGSMRVTYLTLFSARYVNM